MDDLRAALGSFDADAPLAAAPEPWDYLPMPALRDGPPWAMAEMIAAQPALADRIARRLVADGSAHALAAAVRATTFSGGPVLTTGCGTSEHASLAAAALLRDGWRRAGLPGWGPVSAQALELSLDPPAGGLVIGCSHEGRHGRHDRGDERRQGPRRADGGRHRQRRRPGHRRRGHRPRHGRDGPQLVPHRRLRLPDGRHGGDERPARRRDAATGGLCRAPGRRDRGCPRRAPGRHAPGRGHRGRHRSGRSTCW